MNLLLIVCQSRKPPNYNETVLSHTANAAVSSSLFPWTFIEPSIAATGTAARAAEPAGGLGEFPAALLAPERNNPRSRHPLIHLFNPDPSVHTQPHLPFMINEFATGTPP